MNTPCVTDLNKRLNIEAPVRASEEGGAAVISWQTIATVWAALRPASGREVGAQDSQTLRTSHVIWLRWRDDLSGGMRFRWGLRTFEITAIRDPDELQRWLVCQADERRA
jgi:SPP1 family predicted phage head-tail adaptor